MKPEDLIGKYIITTHDEKFIWKILEYVKEDKIGWTFNSYVYTCPDSFKDDIHRVVESYVLKDKSDWKFLKNEDEVMAHLI